MSEWFLIYFINELSLVTSPEVPDRPFGSRFYSAGHSSSHYFQHDRNASQKDLATVRTSLDHLRLYSKSE